MKIEKSEELGVPVDGVIVQPEHVWVSGLMNMTDGYLVGIRVTNADGEALTIMLPLQFMPTFIRLQQEKMDELHAMMTAPRI